MSRDIQGREAILALWFLAGSRFVSDYLYESLVLKEIFPFYIYANAASIFLSRLVYLFK